MYGKINVKLQLHLYAARRAPFRNKMKGVLFTSFSKNLNHGTKVI